MNEFFRQARRHLALNGRMLIFFGSSGDLLYLKRLIDEAGFTAEVVSTQALVRNDWRVDYYTYRLT